MYLRRVYLPLYDTEAFGETSRLDNFNAVSSSVTTAGSLGWFAPSTGTTSTVGIVLRGCGRTSSIVVVVVVGDDTWTSVAGGALRSNIGGSAAVVNLDGNR